MWKVLQTIGIPVCVQDFGLNTNSFLFQVNSDSNQNLDPGGRGWKIQAFTPKLECMGENKCLKIKTTFIAMEWQKTITLNKLFSPERKDFNTFFN
jgi:hypothetical protein